MFMKTTQAIPSICHILFREPYIFGSGPQELEKLLNFSKMYSSKITKVSFVRFVIVN